MGRGDRLRPALVRLARVRGLVHQHRGADPERGGSRSAGAASGKKRRPSVRLAPAALAAMRPNPTGAGAYPDGSLGCHLSDDVPRLLECIGGKAARSALAGSRTRLADESPVFLIDRAGRFRGWRPFGELRRAAAYEAIGRRATGRDAAAPADATAAVVLEQARLHGWPAVPVVDPAGRLLGAVAAEPRQG